MKSIIWKVISLVLSVLMSAGVMTVFKGCNPASSGSWMHCHSAQILVCIVGIAAALSFLLSIILGQITGKRVFSVLFELLGALLAVLAAALPGTLLGMCTKTTMRCWILMRPFTIVMCVLILISVVLTVVSILLTRFRSPSGKADEPTDSYEL